MFRQEPGYNGLDVYDVVNQHLVSHHFRFGAGREAEVSRSPHRYVWPAELDLMAQLARMKLESRRRLDGDGVHRRVRIARLGLSPGRRVTLE